VTEGLRLWTLMAKTPDPSAESGKVDGFIRLCMGLLGLRLLRLMEIVLAVGLLVGVAKSVRRLWLLTQGAEAGLCLVRE